MRLIKVKHKIFDRIGIKPYQIYSNKHTLIEGNARRWYTRKENL